MLDLVSGRNAESGERSFPAVYMSSRANLQAPGAMSPSVKWPLAGMSLMWAHTILSAVTSLISDRGQAQKRIRYIG